MTDELFPHASDRELIRMWREQAAALYEDGSELRRAGELRRAEDAEIAAAAYADDADRLEEALSAAA